jgi:hypothetical protein
LYALNRDQDEDSPENDEMHVCGPTGYRNFMESNKSNINITWKDIFRSSLYVHKKVDDIRNGNMRITDQGLTEIVRNENNTMGNVARIFTIPVCRNPNGEAISSVWADKGRNYSCICGEFSWNGPHYTFESNEMTRFLMLSGFAVSED